jgi:hypothetical protein
MTLTRVSGDLYAHLHSTGAQVKTSSGSQRSSPQLHIDYLGFNETCMYDVAGFNEQVDALGNRTRVAVIQTRWLQCGFSQVTGNWEGYREPSLSCDSNTRKCTRPVPLSTVVSLVKSDIRNDLILKREGRPLHNRSGSRLWWLSTRLLLLCPKWNKRDMLSLRHRRKQLHFTINHPTMSNWPYVRHGQRQPNLQETYIDA